MSNHNGKEGGRLLEARTSFTVARDAFFMAALILPFVGQAFPYGVPIYFPCVVLALALSLLCGAWRQGVGRLSFGNSAFPLLLSVAFLFFLYGFVITVTWDRSLLSETFNGVGAMFLWVAVANRPLDESRLRQLERRFMNLLLAVAVPLALLGLAKFALLLQGHRLSFVEKAAAGNYPWGTSLTVDYNMYALTMLAGVLAAAVWIVESRRMSMRLVASLLLFVLFAAGFLAGSRRFWIMAPLTIGLIFAASARRIGAKGVLSGIASLSICAAVLAWAAYQFGPDNWESLAKTGLNLQARLASVVDGGHGSGLDSRAVRWDFAFSMLTDWRIWTGSGFDYLHAFGCRFGGCLAAEYPHNPLISALLYGGIAGMLSALALIVYFLYGSLRLLAGEQRNPFLGTLLIAHVPITLISSNGPFAVKSLLVMGLLCALHLSVCKPVQGADRAANARRLAAAT